MTELVYESLEKSKHALIEAGAGTGKSIAYLLASYIMPSKTVSGFL